MAEKFQFEADDKVGDFVNNGTDDSYFRDSVVSLDLGSRSPSWANPFILFDSPSDSPNASNSPSSKSFSCVDIIVNIVNTSDLVDSTNKSYTAYEIGIQAGLAQWNINRRYTDFYYLHQQLCKSKSKELSC